MKKYYLSIAMLLTLGSAFLFNSCIGSFALTNRVLNWNNNIGSKFVNELVFVAFWILPVYEVTSLADLLVINSIEFWSGNNPVQASTTVIDSENGRYLVKCDGKGYDVINETTGSSVRLNFDFEEQTWSVYSDGKDYPFMTYLDEDHVKMITPDGDFRVVELSQDGVMAYTEMAGQPALAHR